MSNMSYCEIENTSKDLAQVLQSLANRGISERSTSELKAFKRLKTQCELLLSEYSFDDELDGLCCRVCYDPLP